MSTTPIYDELASRYLGDRDKGADEPRTGDGPARANPVAEQAGGLAPVTA